MKEPKKIDNIWVFERKTAIVNVHYPNPLPDYLVGVTLEVAEKLDEEGVDELHFYWDVLGERKQLVIKFSDFVVFGGVIDVEKVNWLVTGVETTLEQTLTVVEGENWRTRYVKGVINSLKEKERKLLMAKAVLRETAKGAVPGAPNRDISCGWCAIYSDDWCEPEFNRAEPKRKKEYSSKILQQPNGSITHLKIYNDLKKGLKQEDYKTPEELAEKLDTDLLEKTYEALKGNK